MRPNQSTWPACVGLRRNGIVPKIGAPLAPSKAGSIMRARITAEDWAAHLGLDCTPRLRKFAGPSSIVARRS
jgi:hypothetical protein